MAMSRTVFSRPTAKLSLGAIVGIGASVGCALGVATLSLNSEALLRSSFSSALSSAPGAKVASHSPKTVPMAGSEEFWLSAINKDDLKKDGTIALSKTVAIGDRITMTLGGIDRQMDVASVANFEPHITTIDTASNSTRLVLITARDSRDSASRPIRFVMEIDNGDASLVAAKPARAL